MTVGNPRGSICPRPRQQSTDDRFRETAGSPFQRRISRLEVVHPRPHSPIPSVQVGIACPIAAGFSESMPELSLPELRARWSSLFGRPAPKSFRRKFLAKAVAYEMQVQAYGGLSGALKHRLRGIAEAARNRTFDASTVGPRIKPGTKLVRTWHGTTHTLTDEEHGAALSTFATLFGDVMETGEAMAKIGSVPSTRRAARTGTRGSNQQAERKVGRLSL